MAIARCDWAIEVYPPGDRDPAEGPRLMSARFADGGAVMVDAAAGVVSCAGLARTSRMAKRTITPNEAARGIAISSPMKSNRYPNANRENINQTGLSLTR